ncbi:gluconate 2-dehydrogenase subunit 3 family protein [Aquisalinus flavus]|uniref:Gluconate 2-dehydrogenase subunit 3 n=1 Tax=Aquisalinus flavus TaxID=1526572 RepID=A0A8J2Y842_9PROT|nr:gluconate 2-dehydrogenase subunit 3 family protein [Aquisalinus flavus]MBD0425771.1 gluconate 2-dehydrogenase subunit 3 family protein [Aquisalinus flavus]UNE48621.1 gluconate 2-dehydrogenase subunit 3 family protein [Aquisalinus flavus]GGD13442.1 hypothetical protein GCM10011342_22720 [Aquisalinus flavus]
MSDNDPMTINRRTLLRQAVYMVGGAAGLNALAACSDQSAEGDAIPRLSGPGRYFTGVRMTRLKVIVDTIIPDTDTPGAVAAGVHTFIDQMMADWAEPDTRDQFDKVIDEIDERAVAAHGDRLTRLPQEQRFAVIRDYDAEKLGQRNWPYRRFKDLVLVGYYHSQIGATEELQYELIPGEWKACLPLAEVGSAWAD